MNLRGFGCLLFVTLPLGVLVACGDSGESGGAGGGSTGGNSAVGGGGGGNHAPAAIRVTGMGAEEITNGGVYAQTNLDGIPPWSDGVADISVTNISGGSLTVHSVTLTPIGETEAYEWTVNAPGTTAKVPTPVSEVDLADGDGMTFGLFFYPLASGQRDVEVTIEYGEGQTFTFTMAARGRDNATFSPVVSNQLERVFGRSNVEHSNSFQPGGLAADASGNVFFNGNVNEWADLYGENLVMVRVASDGSLSWVRELQEEWPQESRDIGNNQEIGGGEDSLAVDASGHAYIVAERAVTSNQAWQAFVMQVDSTSGDLQWARGLTLNPNAEEAQIASQALRAQSVDATLADRVLVAGQVADSDGAFLAALKKSDGSLLWAESFSLGGVHRVAGLSVDQATGRAYLAGIANNGPFVARIDGVSGASPTLGWARGYNPGFANVHSIALDGDGLLAAIGVRGATTHFVGARLSTSDGSIVWSKVWDADNAGDSNNTVTVVKHDGRAVFSGRVAFTPFDTQGGDGFLLSLDPMTGAYDSGAFYYGGKGTEEIEADFLTGLVSTPNGLWALHQNTPGSNNHEHFWGRWYQANDATLDLPGGDGSGRLADYPMSIAASSASFGPLTNCTAHPASVDDSEWVDVTDSVDYAEPVAAEAEHYQTGTHALLQRLSIAH
ncbi:MAG: hypothetical protein U0271_27980 [Polyangiaceae bacterium]